MSAPLSNAGVRRGCCPSLLVVGGQVAEVSELVDPAGRQFLEVTGPRGVHCPCLTGKERVEEDVGEQRVAEPRTLPRQHDHARVDRFTQRMRVGDTETCSHGGEHGRVGRAPPDGQDAGQLAPRGGQSAPRVEEGLAELVGEVRGQFRGAEVATPDQQLAEIGVAARPVVDLLDEPRRGGLAEQQ